MLNYKEPWYWLNYISKDFLYSGDTPYIQKDVDVKDHFRQFAKKVALLKNKPELEEIIFDYISRGYYLIPTPGITNFLTEKESAVSCFGSYTDDSVYGLMFTDAEIGMMSKLGGGTSAYLGHIRAKGSPITGGGVADGVMRYALRLQDTTGYINQKSRRGKCAAYLDFTHPEIHEWLTIMDKESELQELPFGVCISDEDIAKIKSGDKAARNIWAKVIKKRFQRGFPYIFFTDNVNNNKPEVYADAKITHSNLCFTGETLVAVADGRNAVSIQQLANESGGKIAFPVYSAREAKNHKGWKTEVKNAVAFKTGEQKVIEIILSNGTSFKCTEEHQLALPNNTYIKAKDSLGQVLEKFYSSQPTELQSPYRRINSFTNGFANQHRLIWEFHNGPKPTGFHIDHIISGSDDNIENLQLLSREQHFTKTSEERKGENNPRFRVKNEELFRRKQSVLGFGLRNSNCNGLTDEELIKIGRESHARGMVVNSNNCKTIDSRFPATFSKNRFNGSNQQFKKYVFGEETYTPIVYPEPIQSVKETNYGGFEFLDTISVIDIICHDEIVPVYDLTVEDNHNFYIITKGDENYGNSEGVLVHNCTEIALPDSEDESYTCVLLGLNLVHFDDFPKDVVDVGFYILDAFIDDFIAKNKDNVLMQRAVRFAERHRAIGMGASGWHSYLQLNNIAVESMDAKHLNNKVFKWMQEKALVASKKLATEYGEVEKTKGLGRRNTTMLAIAPNTSSSEIFGQWSQSIEPLYSNYVLKALAKGKRMHKNPILEDLLESVGKNTEAIWDGIAKHNGSVQHLDFLDEHQKNVFKTFAEISPMELAIQNAQRQKYIDQGISYNTLVLSGTPAKDVSKLYLECHSMGIKTLYYQLNQNSAQQFTRKSILECASCSG